MMRTKRKPVRGAVALIAALAVLLVACGDGTTTDDPDDGAVDDGAASDSDDGTASETGDRVVFALGDPGVETNRSWTVTEFTLIQLEPIFESLLSNDPETAEAIPSLAESWEVSDDLRTWSFKLREGVQFHHDWGEFTSEDVLHSWGLWTREDSISVMRSAFVSAEVTAPGPYEVVFEFETPRFDGEDLFTRTRTQGYIYSKAQFDAEGLEGYDELPAGTGFYMYKERREGESVLYERNPNHWSGTMAEFEEMEYRWQPEDSTRLSMLLAGEADIVVISRELQPQAVDAGMTVIPGFTSSYQTVLHFGGTFYATPGVEPDMTDPVVASPLVRQAINKAWNRQVILDEVYLGETGGSELVYNMGWTPEREGWNEAWVEDFDEHYGYDPERALELIEEAGYTPEDIKPVLRTYELAGSPEYGLVMESLQIDLADIGIEATIDQVEVDIAVDDVRGFDTPRTYIGPIRNTPIRPALEWVRFTYQTNEAGWPIYSHEEIEGIFAEWDGTLDLEERDRLAQEVGDHIYYNYVTMPMVQTGINVVVNSDTIGGWTYPGVTSSGITHFELIQKAG